MALLFWQEKMLYQVVKDKKVPQLQSLRAGDYEPYRKAPAGENYHRISLTEDLAEGLFIIPRFSILWEPE